MMCGKPSQLNFPKDASASFEIHLPYDDINSVNFVEALIIHVVQILTPSIHKNGHGGKKLTSP
jgi:hypothetical protein